MTRAGYIPRTYTNASGYGWCQHTIYDSAYNSSGASQTVYYQPNGAASCGSINADEGKVANKPLLVLRTSGSYSFVQYVTNTSNTGASHVLFKRGWVLTNKLTVKKASNPSGLQYNNNNNRYYIKNLATGLYLDVESYSSADGANIHVWNFHGGFNQEWILQSVTANGSTYTKIVSGQDNLNKVLHVTELTAVKGNNIELDTIANPSKDQEFILEKTGDSYGSYYIKSRCGANFLTLGITSGDSGAGGEVYLCYPSNNDYNKWVLESAYRENADYVYWDRKIKDDSTSNGVNVSFNMTNINRTKQVGTTTFNFTSYNNSVLSSWSWTNSKITVTHNPNSLNVVTWSDKEYYHEVYRTYIAGDANVNTANNTASITMYYENILKYFNTNEIERAWKSSLAHEIGHVLGLEHQNTSSVYSSIMSTERDKTVVYVPTKVDIAAVKKNYMN